MKSAIFALSLSAACMVASPAGAKQESPNTWNGEEPPTSFRDAREQIDRDLMLGEKEDSAPDARAAIQAFGKCVAERNAGETTRLLTMDFRSGKYRTGMKLLGKEDEQTCVDKSFRRGTMRSNTVLFAGALAEAMLKADSAPLNARLARNAATDAPSYSETDTIAQCLVRSLPDQAAALFASEVASPAETAAADPLLQAVPVCARAARISARVELSVPALRAIMATAGFRLINAGETHA